MPRFIAPGDRATIAPRCDQPLGQPAGGAGEGGSRALRITGGPQTAVKLADKQRTILALQRRGHRCLGLAPIQISVTAGKLKVVCQAAL